MGLKEEVSRAWDEVLSPIFEEFSTEVLVQSVDVASTVPDALYDEPAAEKAFTPPVPIRARVKLGKDRLVLAGGEAIDVDGRVTVRADELAAKGISLEIGSRITFQGERFIAVHRETGAQVADDFLLVRVSIRKEGV